MRARERFFFVPVSSVRSSWDGPVGAAAQLLPSWNDGATKTSITDFVARVTTPGGPDFVPAEQRIATFDNDGTLWAEQPVYFQVQFAIDQVKARPRSTPSGRRSSRSRRFWTTIARRWRRWERKASCRSSPRRTPA